MTEMHKMREIDLITPSKELEGLTLKLPALQSSFLELQYVATGHENAEVAEHRQYSLAITPVFLARVLHPKVLCQCNDIKTVIQISIDLKDSKLQLQPGDTIGIIPENNSDEVEQLLKLLDIEKNSKDTVILHVHENIKKRNIPTHLHTVSSLYNTFKTCVDIRAVPKKLFIRCLASYTSNENERRRLEELCSQQGGQDYSSLVVGGSLTISDLLKAFPSCKPPPTCLLEHLPPLQPRVYSVSTVSDNIVNIVFSVLPQGLCTSWMMNKFCPILSIEDNMALLNLDCQPKEDMKIPVFIRKFNDFHLPDKCADPLILIGAGTGISPFIGFLQKREKERQKLAEEVLGEIWLLFGCRYSTKDFIFKSELQNFIDNKTLSRLFLSFSREDRNGEYPKYVQDSIQLYKEEFVEQLLDNNAILFLCGDVKNMAKDVINTIQMVIQEVKGIDKNESDIVMKDLKNSGRLLQDIWR